MLAYDIIIPGFAYLYYNMAHVFLDNTDVVVVSAVGLVLNLAPKVLGVRPWLVWQLVVAYLFYTDFPLELVFDYVSLPQFLGACVVSAALLFRG